MENKETSKQVDFNTELLHLYIEQRQQMEKLVAYADYLAIMLDKSIAYSEAIADRVNGMGQDRLAVKETDIRSLNACRVQQIN